MSGDVWYNSTDREKSYFNCFFHAVLKSEFPEDHESRRRLVTITYIPDSILDSYIVFLRLKKYDKQDGIKQLRDSAKKSLKNFLVQSIKCYRHIKYNQMKANNKELFSHLCNQMNKLSNGEIEIEGAKAQAALARQANNSLRYEIDRATFIAKYGEDRIRNIEE